MVPAFRDHLKYDTDRDDYSRKRGDDYSRKRGAVEG